MYATWQVTYLAYYALSEVSLDECIIYLRQKRRSMYLPAFVCLSIARLLKNAYMEWDEMLRVDRCRDMDELINF